MAAKGGVWGRLLRGLIGLAFGCFLGIAVVAPSLSDPAGHGPIELLILRPAALFLAFYFAIGLHEIGHLIGGLLVGFRFRFCTIGPIEITRRQDRIHVRLTARLLSGGVAGTVPEDDRDLRRRMAVMLASGPAMSLLLALAAGGLTLVLGDRVHNLASFSLWSVAGMSLFLFVVAMIPTNTAGFKSDGAALLLLAKGGPGTDRYVTLFGLASAMSGRGVPYGDLDPEAIARALRLADGTTHEISAHLLAHGHARDRGDIATAGRHLDAAMALRSIYPPSLRPELDLIAAYFEARHRGDLAKARAWLETGRQDSLLKAPYRQALAEAAVLLAEGDHAGARSKAEAGLLQAVGDVNPGAAKSAAGALREILQEASEAPLPVA